MSYETMVRELKEKKYLPVYWLEGEEDYEIDQLVEFFENKVLTPTEKDFNFSVFYGKDADWAALINACRRYPMFSEKQVVILKEAQSMKDLDRLEGYVEKPMPSTILVVAYKWGKLDGRFRLAKLVKAGGGLLTTKKMPESKVPDWVEQYTREKGFQITQTAIMLLVEHTGNELSRIAGEIDKVLVNLAPGSLIDEQCIEDYVGISKEYNIFEFQKALGGKDFGRAMQILDYFQGNPKAAPIQLILPVLFSFFNKVHLLVNARARPDREHLEEMGIPPYFLSDYTVASRMYGKSGAEKALLLLHEYNLRSIGIGDDTDSPGLLKEMVYRMLKT